MERYKGENCEAYQKGYLLGYRVGYQDGKCGKPKIRMEENAAARPLELMRLSTRAYNCLFFSGCRCAADVAKLEGKQIQQIRNLGRVTAAEIAQALTSLGIQGTDWECYLPKNK